MSQRRRLSAGEVHRLADESGNRRTRGDGADRDGLAYALGVTPVRDLLRDSERRGDPAPRPPFANRLATCSASSLRASRRSAVAARRPSPRSAGRTALIASFTARLLIVGVCARAYARQRPLSNTSTSVDGVETKRASGFECRIAVAEQKTAGSDHFYRLRRRLVPAGRKFSRLRCRRLRVSLRLRSESKTT